MDELSFGPLVFHVDIERWPRREPFRIAGYVFDSHECVVVRLERDGATGLGEAAGIYYTGETASVMAERLESLRSQIERGLPRSAIQTLLPPGGARNALDCAIWDLEAKLTGVPAWRRAGLDTPRPLLTTFTCAIDAPDRMAAAALAFTGAKAIKLKLAGDELDAGRVQAVRAALPDIWLSIDANQAFDREHLARLLPVFESLDVKLVEQPFPVGRDEWLDGLRSAIPFAADESVQSLETIAPLVGRYDVINIKLDKCGGLTEALAMTRHARSSSMKTMVGCMGGTSLAMAPAWLVGQLCDVVDLDGPPSLVRDRATAVSYDGGFLHVPPALWG